MFNILVVEDDKNLRKLITTYLQRNKYNTYEATNGEEALNVLDQSYIDLIVSDIMMPKMDGYELIKSLREAKYDGQIADGIISNSKLLDNQFKRAFWLSDHVEILSYGLPRNDFLARQIENTSEYNCLREKFGFEKDCFYILYAPTFRDNYSLEGYKLKYEEIVNEFSAKVNKKTKIVVRLHPNVWNQSDFINYGENILNGTIYSEGSVVGHYGNGFGTYGYGIQYKYGKD